MLNRDMRHHDTTNLTRDELELAELRAQRLEDHIRRLFESRWMEYISPPAVKRHLDRLLQRDVLLTSVRRGISNLTNDGILEKTDNMVDGGYGINVHTWRLKVKDDLFGDSVKVPKEGLQ